jgi:dTDP-4-dehydrorhamnose 3,5-epimerase
MKNLRVRLSDAIAGLLVIERDVFADERGRFLTLHVEGELDPWTETPLRFREDNVSVSHRGVLRGLHGDEVTWKLVQCVAGQVFLAVVDLRPASLTHRKTLHLTLDAAKHLQVLIPPGCVNGHQCLSDESLFVYKQSVAYDGAERQRTVRWNDPQLKIPWPLPDPILSARDAGAPLLP